jgi:hypothetical protein
MSNLSVNQLYKLSGAANQGINFKDWATSEKALYQLKIDSGKITGKMPFCDWLNKRWAMKTTNLNLIGSVPIINLEEAKKAQKEKGTVGSKIVGALKDIGKGVIKKTILDDQTSDQEDTAAGNNVIEEKRILGMKPAIAYTVGTVLLLSAIAGAIYAYKKSQKSA